MNKLEAALNDSNDSTLEVYLGMVEVIDFRNDVKALISTFKDISGIDLCISTLQKLKHSESKAI